MHLISFDASPRQISKLRNGHKVRIKRGSGCNLVVNPSNYKLVSRAFTKNKGLELSLSPEELDINKAMGPEQHDAMAETVDSDLFQHLPFAEGGSIFKKIKKALNSKTAKQIGRELKPLSRALKSSAREIAHEKIAEAHMGGADRYGDNEHLANLMNIGALMAHEKVGGNLKSMGRQIKKALNSKTAKQIGRELKPLSRALKSSAREIAHEKIADAHMAGADRYGDNRHMAGLMNIGAQMAHEKVGSGLGAGLYAYPSGRGMNAHEALRLANTATAHANHQLAKMHNATVHGQLTQPPIKSYWNEPLEPRSRGTNVRNGMNLIRGRGSLLTGDDILPPALQSQPYGANFHMQFFLPPEYHKYNDGTDMEGRGLYV
jgi:uncharacterized protein with PIN domain